MTDRYVICNFSGGKDSTAMVLRMIELGEHIDEIINVDTGMEYPPVYAHIDKVRAIAESAGIKFTVLHPKNTFEYYMLERPVHSKQYGDHNGYGWPRFTSRWCTALFKKDLIAAYVNSLDTGKDILFCIGLAADETKRLARSNNKTHRHPLAEWGWTEADALQYCYDKGFDWGGLYKSFNRLSCWCCPLQSTNDLRMLHRDYPDLWRELQRLEDRLESSGIDWPPFKNKHTVRELGEIFEHEEKADSHLL